MKLDNSSPCPVCGRYANRGVSVDAVVIKDGTVLLVQRGVEPDKGLWGTPGGFVGWDESAEDAVKREVKEETGLDVEKVKMVGVYSHPKRHPKQVINIVYLVEVKEGGIEHGDDAINAKWIPLDNLPSQMALDHQQNIQDALKMIK